MRLNHDSAARLRDLPRPRSVAAAIEPAGFQLGRVPGRRLLGPFDNTKMAGFNKAYPPEQGLPVQAGYDGKNGSIRWIEHVTANPYGVVDLNQALAAPLAEAPGGTTSKWRVALRVPAFLRSSNMRTTAFGSRAVSRTLINSLPFVVKSFTDTSKHCKVLPAS